MLIVCEWFLGVTHEGSFADALSAARIPHSRRKRRFKQRYVSATLPFHSRRLESVVPALERDAARLGVRFERAALQTALFATDDG